MEEMGLGGHFMSTDPDTPFKLRRETRVLALSESIHPGNSHLSVTYSFVALWNGQVRRLFYFVGRS